MFGSIILPVIQELVRDTDCWRCPPVNDEPKEKAEMHTQYAEL